MKRKGRGEASDYPSRSVTRSSVTQGGAPLGVARLPKYVRACDGGDWHLSWWRYSPATGEVLQEGRAPFRCRSWRHKGPCRRWRAAQNFSRTNQALLRCRPKDVVFCVFTVRPGDWSSRFEAFRELRDCWRSLRKAITRAFGGNRYVSTVEVHRSGWPHLNVVMESPLLAQFVGKGKGGGAITWLKKHALACGFGYMASAERAQSRRALAGYIVKLAGEVEHAAHPDATGRLVGEVVKLSQVPERAPSHFRRLRSSIRFLPPPYKRPDVSGELVRAPLPAGVQPPSCEVTGGQLAPQGVQAVDPVTGGPRRGQLAVVVEAAPAVAVPAQRARDGPDQLGLALGVLTAPPRAPGAPS